jgi:general secretion pathway protein D
MKKAVLLVCLALAAAGCATFDPNYKKGNEAEINMKWDEAIPYYEKASMANPHDPVYRLALLRAKHAASLSYLTEGRRLAAQGKTAEALAAYDRALLYDPLNTLIIAERSALAGQPVPEAAAPPETIEPPIKLKAKEEKLVLNFPAEASLRSLFLTLGKAGGVNILFDENFRDIPFSINLSDVTFEQALASLCAATKNFYRIIDEHTVIIVPDNPMKRLQYEMNAIRSFTLSNIKAEDILPSLQQMLSSQFKAVKVFADKNLNMITVRDTPATIAMAGKLIRLWDRPKGEVVIDLELMEVSRTKLRQLGLYFDQNTIGLRYGPPAATSTDTTADSTTSDTTNWKSLGGLNFGNKSNYYVNLPTAYLDFLQTDSDTKLIAQPRLRGVSDLPIETNVGQLVPIPQTTFTPIAAGGVNQQPVTSFEYKNVGINIKVTPHVHPDGDVTLEMDLEITSLGGTGFGDLPIITNRKVKNTLRLKDGETNLLAGLLRDDERKSLTGIPGLMSLPVLGRLFSREVTNIEQTDVILTITPYIIRKVPITAEDKKPIWVDVQPTGGQASEEGDEEMSEELPEEEAPPVRPQPPPSASQIVFSPGNFELPKNRDFRIMVNVRSGDPLSTFSTTVSFNPQVLKLKDVTPGPILSQLGPNAPFLKNIDNASGTCTIGFTSPDMAHGTPAAGPLAILLFEGTSAGEATITAMGVNASSPGGKPLNFDVRAARVVIR